MRLGAAEHIRWLVLRRVNAGGVAKSGNGWVRHGTPLAIVPTQFLEVFLEQGLVEMIDPSSPDGLSPVRLTATGKVRYSELCRKQRRRDDLGAGTR